MSKILKRPMFRKGGSADSSTNRGVMKIANPRSNFQVGGEANKRYEENLKLLQQAAGPAGDSKQDLYDMLISGGLNLAGGVGAGDGTLASIARSFKQPAEQFLAKRPGEEQFQRQLRVATAQSAITQEEAEKLARLKAQGESSLQKDYTPERIYYESLKTYTDPKASTFTKTIQQQYPESFAEFAAYIGPAIRKNENLKSRFIGVVPLDTQNKNFEFSKMVAGGIYFKPDTKKLYERDPEKNILIEIDPYTGDKLRELPLK
jgi:predicted transcriptional regulator